MGLLMEKELKHLRDGLEKPAKPFVVILGGAKVSDKIAVLKVLMEKADTLLIGGAMANTFLKAEGIPVGASRVESDKIDLAREILDLAKKRGVKFLLPIDAVEAEEIRAGVPIRNTSRLSPQHGISDGWLAVICISERHWRGTATALGKPELIDDPRFATAKDRVANIDAVDEEVSSFTKRRTRAELGMPDGFLFLVC